MMQTDVKAAYVTGTGNAFAGPARVKAISVVSTGAAVVELTDGSATGTSRLKFDIPTSATENPFYWLIPGEGVWCPGLRGRGGHRLGSFWGMSRWRRNSRRLDQSKHRVKCHRPEGRLGGRSNP